MTTRRTPSTLDVLPRMKPGSVPTHCVAPILEELILDRWPYGGGYDVLAEKVGCDQSSIESIVDQDSPGAEFDLVDKLFCALGRVDVWRGQLADVYENMVFVETCELHSCSRTFPENPGRGNRQRFCSRKCQNLAKEVRTGRRTGDRRAKRGLFIKCGHRITPENTVWITEEKRTCKSCRRQKMIGYQRAYRLRVKQRAET